MAKFTNPKERDDENDIGEAVSQVIKHEFATPAPPSASFDMQQFAEIMARALKESQVAAIEETKPRIKEREDWENPQISVFNPVGELARPRPGLRCPMFWGVLADKDTDPPIALYEIESAQTTYDEQVLLNQVREQRGTMEMNDGVSQPYEIYEQKDRVTKHTLRLIIAFPKEQYEKGRRNSLPGMKRMAKDLIERQSAVA
jgi:hypothetical protein